MTSETPAVSGLTYKGRPVEDLTRDEMIAALICVVNMNKSEEAMNMRTVEFYQSMLKARR